MIKNKKNGFTLIELISTIGLLAILAVVILANVVGMKSNEEARYSQRFDKSLEEAACSYVDMLEYAAYRNNWINSGVTLYLSNLESVGLIAPDTLDPKTNKTIGDYINNNGLKNCISVKVTWESNGSYKVKKCKVNRGASCS